MTVIFRPAAVDDIVEAAAWYEAHATGLGEELMTKFQTQPAARRKIPNYFALFIATEAFGVCLRIAFPTGFSSPSSAKRSTFTRSSTLPDTIGDGQSACDSIFHQRG